MKNILNRMRSKWILDIPESTKHIINSIEYDILDEINLKKYIKTYIDENIDFNILKNNWNDIKLLSKNDSSSLNSMIIRYGEVFGKHKFEEKNKKCKITREYIIEKYGEEEGNKKLSNRGASLENYILRYGEVLGIKKWNEYLYKRKKTYEKRKGSYQSRTLSWYQEKHGLEKGYEIWDNKRKKQAYKISTKYYIEKYGEEEGKKLIYENKSRGLQFYIKKYGEEEGQKRYNDKINKIKKYTYNMYSKWSIEIIEKLKKEIIDLFYYGENELIWKISECERNIIKAPYKRYIKPDLFYNGRIIEFNGDLFHANPNMFMENDTPNPYKNNLTAKQIWEKDEQKINYYKLCGYEVLIIWNDEYNKNPEEVINKCLTFLK
jgi:hypothetical protein